VGPIQNNNGKNLMVEVVDVVVVVVFVVVVVVVVVVIARSISMYQQQ